jgi:hypothetical protein
VRLIANRNQAAMAVVAEVYQLLLWLAAGSSFLVSPPLSSHPFKGRPVRPRNSILVSGVQHGRRNFGFRLG